MDPLRAIVFYATGIKEEEFEREAIKFAKFHKLPSESVIPVNCKGPLWKRRKVVLEALAKRHELEVVAMFCHGWPRRIQFGFNLENVEMLAGAMDDAASTYAQVILYACSCGRRPGLSPKKRIYYPDSFVGEDSFAYDLAISCDFGKTVWAHYDSGHTTRNPFVLVFESYGCIKWMVPPFHKDWARWVKDLKGKKRFNFFEEGS